VTFDILRAVTAIVSLFGRMCSNVTEATAASFFYRTQESKRIFQVASTFLQITRRNVTEDTTLDNECMIKTYIALRPSLFCVLTQCILVAVHWGFGSSCPRNLLTYTAADA
jgi:hypothetical protein